MEETGINDYAHYTNKDGSSYFLWSFQSENRDSASTLLKADSILTEMIIDKCSQVKVQLSISVPHSSLTNVVGDS